MYNDELLADKNSVEKMQEQYKTNSSKIFAEIFNKSVDSNENIKNEIDKLQILISKNIMNELALLKSLEKRKKEKLKAIIKNKILKFNENFIFFSQKNVFFNDFFAKNRLKTAIFQNLEILYEINSLQKNLENKKILKQLSYTNLIFLKAIKVLLK